jgi:hypothetical protein
MKPLFEPLAASDRHALSVGPITPSSVLLWKTRPARLTEAHTVNTVRTEIRWAFSTAPRQFAALGVKETGAHPEMTEVET